MAWHVIDYHHSCSDFPYIVTVPITADRSLQTTMDKATEAIPMLVTLKLFLGGYTTDLHTMYVVCAYKIMVQGSASFVWPSDNTTESFKRLWQLPLTNNWRLWADASRADSQPRTPPSLVNNGDEFANHLSTSPLWNCRRPSLALESGSCFKEMVSLSNSWRNLPNKLIRVRRASVTFHPQSNLTMLHTCKQHNSKVSYLFHNPERLRATAVPRAVLLLPLPYLGTCLHMVGMTIWHSHYFFIQCSSN